jgi:TolB-like protein
VKKALFCLFTLFSVVGLFAQDISLDQAVQSSARTIESRLSQGSKVAVLVFTSSAQAFSDYIIDEIATAISASNKIQVIDRQHTDAIRRELNIQMSGDVSDNEVRRVGHQLGAQFVITGSLVDIGNAYRFRIAAINVESAVREGSSSINVNINDPQIVFLLTGKRVTETIDTNPSNTTGTSAFFGTWLLRGNGFTGTLIIEANRITIREQNNSGGSYHLVISNPTWTAVNNNDHNTLSDYPRDPIIFSLYN